MASSLFILIDDIASVLDDVAVLAKVAGKKTAGVLGDDLALNAQQVTGVNPERELPVVWAVAKGSLMNKAILVPVALAISAFVPWLVVPLLMIGGAFLCFEGVEKLAHRFLHKAEEEVHHAQTLQALADPAADLVALEQEKIRGAIRTDFVLSAEIIAITLGTVTDAPFLTQLTVLVGIAVAITVGVYGLVAGIVKMDDAGLYLSQRHGEGALTALQRRVGAGLLRAAPWLMKALSVAGTAAMFLVGGGIVMHGIPAAHHLVESATHWVGALPALGGILAALTPPLVNAVGGVITGALVLLAVMAVQRLRRPAMAKA
ncbi:MAG: DUF808 domain-containing protein [Thiohalomonadaceae bacterium]